MPAVPSSDPTNPDPFLAYIPTILIPQGDYAQGEQVISFERALAADEDYCHFRANRDAFTADDHVDVTFEISLDGGATWEFLCGFITQGPVVQPLPAIALNNDARMSGPVFRGKGLEGRLVRARMGVTKVIGKTTTKVDFLPLAMGLVPAPAEEPHSVAFDASSSTDFANVSSVSWTHTASGTPSGVGVGIGNIEATGAAATVTSVTYDGNSCTQAVSGAGTSLTLESRADIWYRGSPGSGAKTVAVTFSSANRYGVAGAITVTGGHTSAVFSNTNSAASTGDNITVNCTSATGELVMDVCVETSVTNGDVRNIGSGQTSRWNQRNGASSAGGMGSTEAGAASVTMDWTRTHGSSDYGWAQAAASFKVAATSGFTHIVSAEKEGGTDGGTSAAVDTTGANFIVVSVTSYASATAATLSDSKSNTWTGLTEQVGTQVRCRQYYASNPSVGSGHTFTVSGTGTYSSLYMSAYSNSSGGVVFDTQNGQQTGAAGTTIQPGSITPSVNNCLVFCSFSSLAEQDATINGGFTVRNTRVHGAGFAGGAADLIQTTAAAANPTWTWSSNSGGITDRAAVISSFMTATGRPYHYYTMMRAA